MDENKKNIPREQIDEISGGIDLGNYIPGNEQGEKKAVIGGKRRKPGDTGGNDPNALF